MLIEKIKKWDTLAWGSVLITALVMLALMAPWLAPFDPDEIDLSRRLLSPDLKYWMGTDSLGRDNLSRMFYGARVSLGVGTTAVALSTFIGVVFGALAGYLGRWVDAVVMRIVDILMCIPTLFLVLMLIVILKPGIQNVVIVIALTGWTGVARLVRAEVLSLKSREYILAARAAGASPTRIVFKHLIPNAMAPVYVSATFGVAAAIMMESSLSFLGLGVQPPTASWGSIIASGREYMMTGWWLTLFPGLAILFSMLIVNMMGEGLREYFQPKDRA